MIIGGLQSQLSSGNHFQTSVTDRQTDRVQTYSPLRFHRWGTNKIMHAIKTTQRYIMKKIVFSCCWKSSARLYTFESGIKTDEITFVPFISKCKYLLMSDSSIMKIGKYGSFVN